MARFALPRYDVIHQGFVWWALGVWAAITGVTALLFVFGPNTVPLWYSLVQPQEQLVPNWALVSLPIVSSLLLVSGLWFGRRTDLEHEQYLASMQWWSVCFLQSFLLLALLRIVKVVL